MKNEKSKEKKRIKLLRLGLIVGVILVFLSIYQLIFESDGTFIKVIQGVILIFWIVAAIINWFEYKKAKTQLQNQP